METIATEQGLPIQSWCKSPDRAALQQAYNLARLPFVYHHIALMPDCHSGYGMPIGGVVACLDTVIPNAVGVDIGCGMCAVQTDVSTTSFSAETIRSLIRQINAAIPTGFKHHKNAQTWDGFNDAPDSAVIAQELHSARKQMGTLGGGNHFIELQKDSIDKLWLMIHCGSRNFGLKIATLYHQKALAYCTQQSLALPDNDLAFLPIDHADAREYLSAMQYAMRFAEENRRQIKERCLEIITEHFPHTAVQSEINIHHNFAALEHHFGTAVMVHRKGATSARAQQMGIIPGSMGSASYIVRGKGNPQSFESCSHGAGRAMGRNEANRQLTLTAVKDAIGLVQIAVWPRDRSGALDLSEAPQAYKNIDTVMAEQADLVEIVERLLPLGVVKG